MNVWSVLLQVLPWAAGAAATAAIAITVSVSVRRRVSIQMERLALDQADTAAALEDAEISTLGFHLVERLGSTTVRNYNDDEEVREDFDRAFGAVKAYLGAGSGSGRDVSIAAQPEAENSVERPAPLSEMEQDELWDALAKARRDLEKNLRRVLGDNMTTTRPTLGRLIVTAREERVLSETQAKRLTRAVQYANQVIHGEPSDPRLVSESISTLNDISGKLAHEGPPADQTEKSDRTLHVAQNGDGNWRVMRSGSAVRSATFSTQREAMDRAREIAYRSGGGEVVIHGRDGRIYAKDTVASKGDPRSSGPATKN